MSKGLGRHASVRRRAVALLTALAVTAASGAYARPAPGQRWLLAIALVLGVASWASAHRARRSTSGSTSEGHLSEALLAAAVLVVLLLLVDLSHLDETPWDLAVPTGRGQIATPVSSKAPLSHPR